MSWLRRGGAVTILAWLVAPVLLATPGDSADQSINQLQIVDGGPDSYRATRRLEAEHGDKRGWLEATTEYSPASGFRYRITAEGGADYIRERVLRPVLDEESAAIARGGATFAALTGINYTFTPNGVGADGLITVMLSPRRKDRDLVDGTMFLQGDGALVRLQGRLVKSPSFWVKHVDIVRSYRRIEGAVVPVSLESKAQLRMLGAGTMRMTYSYSEINGHRVLNPDNHTALD
jgi:hypothetical protein